MKKKALPRRIKPWEPFFAKYKNSSSKVFNMKNCVWEKCAEANNFSDDLRKILDSEWEAQKAAAVRQGFWCDPSAQTNKWNIHDDESEDSTSCGSTSSEDIDDDSDSYDYEFDDNLAEDSDQEEHQQITPKESNPNTYNQVSKTYPDDHKDLNSKENANPSLDINTREFVKAPDTGGSSKILLTDCVVLLERVDINQYRLKDNEGKEKSPDTHSQCTSTQSFGTNQSQSNSNKRSHSPDDSYQPDFYSRKAVDMKITTRYSLRALGKAESQNRAKTMQQNRNRLTAIFDLELGDESQASIENSNFTAAPFSPQCVSKSHSSLKSSTQENSPYSPKDGANPPDKTLLSSEMGLNAEKGKLLDVSAGENLDRLIMNSPFSKKVKERVCLKVHSENRNSPGVLSPQARDNGTKSPYPYRPISLKRKILESQLDTYHVSPKIRLKECMVLLNRVHINQDVSKDNETTTGFPATSSCSPETMLFEDSPIPNTDKKVDINSKLSKDVETTQVTSAMSPGCSKTSMLEDSQLSVTAVSSTCRRVDSHPTLCKNLERKISEIRRIKVFSQKSVGSGKAKTVTFEDFQPSSAAIPDTCKKLLADLLPVVATIPSPGSHDDTDRNLPKNTATTKGSSRKAPGSPKNMLLADSPPLVATIPSPRSHVDLKPNLSKDLKRKQGFSPKLLRSGKTKRVTFADFQPLSKYDTDRNLPKNTATTKGSSRKAPGSPKNMLLADSPPLVATLRSPRGHEITLESTEILRRKSSSERKRLREALHGHSLFSS